MLRRSRALALAKGDMKIERITALTTLLMLTICPLLALAQGECQQHF
jgi:hypothetical protein